MRKRSFLVLALIVCTAAFAWFADSLKKGEESMIQRRYAEAVGHLEAALSEEPEERRARVLLLLGRARWLAGNHEGAVAAYRRLLEDYPDSALVPKATLQQAEALAAGKQFRAAAQLYRGQIERLTGPSRKEEIAGTYLGLAEKALAKETPDHARAVTFYDLALDLGLTDEKRASVRLLAADALAKAGRQAEAIARFAPLVEELTVDGGKLRAMIGLGRARSATGDKSGARATLRDLIAIAPKSEVAADAAFEIARTYGVPQPSTNQLDRAISALTDLARDYPEHPKSKVADFLIALCQRHNGQTERALASLRKFLAIEHPISLPEIARARAMVGDVLYAQGKRGDAVVAWRDYLQQHPAHSEWERVQRAIVDAEFQSAAVAYAGGKERFAEARELFDAFARMHPLDGRNPQILFLLGEMLFVEEQYDAARAAYERCVSKYPGKDESSHAQLKIGEIYEEKTFNYHKAIEAYKKVTWGSAQATARQRIARLERKHLHLKTARTYRTGETATFALASRNIQRVRVRVYRLDLETWFRATHLPGQVEKLDIEVIEPDKTFNSEIEDYVQYRETERSVDIGFVEPGAYVVKVDDQELEATTLVLVTDLALIAKTSRHEFFVFTQNLKEDRVESGVRIVLSDGESIVAEGVTDESGVWRYEGDELKNCGELRAFAVNAAGSGAGSLDLSGLGYNQGLTPKGYLFTDRPAYQPGQSMHLKGIVREVEDGLYALPGGKYGVRVQTPSGATVLQSEVSFTPFGTFAIDFAIPEQAELGAWLATVEQHGATTVAYTARFTVARYELPRVSLTSETEQPVVFRGERIRGKFVLRYFYGEPAIGKTVGYRLALPEGGVIERTGVTNAEGVVTFDFETTEFNEEAIAYIQASVAEENVQHALAVPVVTTEFAPKLSMLRKVYLQGEPFDVTVTIADRSGKPLAKSGVVKLLRREKSKAGAIAEVQIALSTFRTKGADGSGVVSLSADKGGDYVVRLEAEDRFGNVVTVALPLKISGDDDEVKLRMLSDRESYRVGETVKVKIANRGSGRLALRTVQGDGILAYAPMRLPAGESTLEVVLEPMHAPNFGLALALIDGHELRTAQRDFLVARDLRLELALKADVAAPGEEVEVAVKATDPTGKPVEAEVALALVDASLLSLYADPAGDMNEFFYGTRRETGFRTTSSCSWSYEGRSRRVSAAILEEERRMREEARAALDPTDSDADVPARDGRGGRRARGRNGAPGPAGPSTPGPTTPGAGGPQTGGGVKFLAAHDRMQSERDKVGAGERESLFGALGQLERYARKQQSGQRNLLGDGLLAFDISGEAAAPDQPRTDFSSSGGWMSSVRTAADGTASVKFRLPDTTTEWRLTGRAVTRDTYVGEARASVRTVKDLQADLVVPWVLTAGDSTKVGGRVHNLTDDDVDVAMVLKQLAGGAETVTEETRSVRAGREENLGFELVAGADGELRLDLAVDGGGGRTDQLVRTIPILPFGVERRVGRAGSVTESAVFQLSLPDGRTYDDLALRIEIGPESGRDLVGAALGQGYRPMNCRRVDFTNLSVASRGLAALTVLEHLEGAKTVTRSDRSRLDGLARAMLTKLLAVQMSDGSFSWVGRKHSDLRTTSQVVGFLHAARKRGIRTAAAPLDRAANWLLGRLPSLKSPERVRASHALAIAGRSRFETLNTLHRQRANLPLDQVARLALAWHAAGRPEMAAELSERIVAKLVLPSATRAGRTIGPVPDASRIEATALAAQALLRGRSDDSDAARAIDWLRGRRVGATWGTPTATAAVLRALVAAGGFERAAADQVEVTITVNGQQLAAIPTAAPVTMIGYDVSAEQLKVSANRVEIGVRGSGRVHYTATLSGFASGITDADRRDQLVRTTRKYLPAFRRHDNKVVRPGFGVASGTYKSFENRMTQLPIGSRGRVESYFYVRGEGNTPHFTPVVVEEPIPAGCTVVRDSVQGRYDHVEFQPDRMIFYYREGLRSDTVRYDIQARFEGSYRALPTKVYGALRPDLVAYGPVGQLAVLARGADPSDTYRMTPDELYHIGKALYDAGDLMGAGGHLDALVKDWRLDDRVFKEVARMMLFVSIERKDSASIVRFFEELKDRYADLVIPFDKILAVGQAYIDLGEFEAAVLVFRATAEASFLKEAAVATTLENMGEVKSAMRFLRDLLDTYPDLNTMRASLYGIGQKLALLAQKMQPGAVFDERVGRRKELQQQAVATFRDFLVMYPEDPLAGEVSFSWASTLVESKDLKGALAVADDALERYPDSALEDELLYTAGYARFAVGESDAAFTILERVASEDFPRANGTTGPSENKKHAIYLQGQIHHALGAPSEALAAYDKVENDFTDAGEAADFFRRKSLTLPEVSTFELGAKAALKVDYRNLEKLDIEVYRVDLMRLYLLHKSLNNIRNIMLHGISPYVEMSVELGDGKDYVDKVHELELALDEAGAYLVVARSGDLVASGMVLRSDLEIVAQESLDIGRVRVNVKRAGAFLGDAHVKVVGSGDGRLRSGDTDLRGIFVADGLVGTSTVIVKLDDQYAFFRGDGIHQPARFRPQPKPAAPQQQRAKQFKGKQFDAFENNLRLNDSNRARQIQWLQKEVLERQQKGVEVYRTK